MNHVYKIGDRYICFIVVREDKGWGGVYEQNRRPTTWQCEDCGYKILDSGEFWTRKRIADHHECGHAPCAYCGQLLLRRKDGTARQHAHNRCPAKAGAFKIEREFAKNITKREYV
jgi:hypothetical protein